MGHRVMSDVSEMVNEKTDVIFKYQYSLIMKNKTYTNRNSRSTINAQLEGTTFYHPRNQPIRKALYELLLYLFI